MRRLIVLHLALFMLQPCASAVLAAEPSVTRLSRLTVLDQRYPRAFFFRASERPPAADDEAAMRRWDQSFSRLMGIAGKAQDEELLGRGTHNPAAFSAFKQRHPDQLVLLHYNGNSRDPRSQDGQFFAGHWIYYNGATIENDLPAVPGEMDVRVSDIELFRVNIGRFKRNHEDIGLCVLDAQGKPDWHQSEQVQLIGIDRDRGTIRVRRGCYGTAPRAFAAGRAYAAAHLGEGPWGKNANLLWSYNYSIHCPRDAKGRNAAEALAADLGARFSDGGELASFDGVEFDVMRDAPGRDRNPRRGADCDADGKIDHGVIDGVNTYGAGVIAFQRRLREHLGEDRLLLADGWNMNHQRGFGILNGIESEGWPSLSDVNIDDWSGGMNRQTFWAARSAAPALNYINHKYHARDAAADEFVRSSDLPWGIHRLVLAAATFTDSAFCYTIRPPSGGGGGNGKGRDKPDIGIWDELVKGADNQLAWLGRPLGPAMHLAKAEKNLLAGADLMTMLRGETVRFAVEGEWIKIAPVDAAQRELRFVISGIPTSGPDLFLSLLTRADALRDAPPQAARTFSVRLSSQSQGRQFQSWIDAQPFESGYYWSDVTLPAGGTKTAEVEMTVEGGEPLYLSRISAHAAPDVVYRRFEHGIVLANPSPRPATIALKPLVSDTKLRRLKATAGQDEQANDGSPVGATIELPSKDGLFLAEQQ